MERTAKELMYVRIAAQNTSSLTDLIYDPNRKGAMRK
jgi:hypothetical protein